MSFSKQTINLEALLYALAQQTEPLPATLQNCLTGIDQFSHEDQSIQLLELIQQYSPLETAYKNALDKWHESYESQQRTKSSGASFTVISKPDDLFIHSVLPTNDWVKSAKKIISSYSSPKQRSNVLERGDRVVTLASGGAFLGVLIAQIPGAIVGGLLAGIYAWFSTPIVETDGNR